MLSYCKLKIKYNKLYNSFEAGYYYWGLFSLNYWVKIFWRYDFYYRVNKFWQDFLMKSYLFYYLF